MLSEVDWLCKTDIGTFQDASALVLGLEELSRALGAQASILLAALEKFILFLFIDIILER